MTGWQSKKAMKSIEQEIAKIADKMGNDMAREIDREVLWGMLKGIGWTRVMLDRLQDNKHAIDITIWLEENIKNPFERNGRDFIFEDPKDATMFILRWV
jgi:hypothetical protein